MIKKKILIATGGTGGHIIPAYSLANHFTKNNFIVNLTSDKRGLKYLDYCKNLKVIKISSSPLVKKNIFKFFISISIIFFSPLPKTRASIREAISSKEKGPMFL